MRPSGWPGEREAGRVVKSEGGGEGEEGSDDRNTKGFLRGKKVCMYKERERTGEDETRISRSSSSFIKEIKSKH